MTGADPTSSSPRRWERWLLAAGILFAWLWFIPYYPQLNPPNESVRVYMTVAMVEDGSFAIDPVVRRWGYVNDKARSCVLGGETLRACPPGSRPGCVCSLYSSKAPLASFLGVPAHWVNVQLHRMLGYERPSRFASFYVLRLFGAILPGLATVWLLWWALGQMLVSESVRRLTTVGFALGSMHFTYSIQLVGHAHAGSALLAACLAIEACRRRAGAQGRAATGWLLAAAAGFLTAAAPALEYPTGLAALACGVFALVRLRPVSRFAAYAVGAGVPILLVAWFHQRSFGSPFTSGYSFLENQLFDTMMAPGFHGVRMPSLKEAATTLGVSLFSMPTGLFFFSPFLMLAWIGLPLSVRGQERPYGRALGWTAVAVVLLMLAYLSSLAIWRGGWQVGPRYIASVVPFLALYAAVGADRVSRWLPVWGDGILAGLVGLAVVLTALPTWIYPHLPEVYVNPVFELVTPLIARGHVPLTLASVLRVYGPVAGVAALGVMGAWMLWVGSGRPGQGAASRMTQLSVMLLLAALVPLLLSTVGEPTRAKRESTARVVDKLYPSDRDALREALSEAVRSGRDPATLGALHARSGDTDRAIRLYRKAIKLPPDAN